MLGSSGTVESAVGRVRSEAVTLVGSVRSEMVAVKLRGDVAGLSSAVLLRLWTTEGGVSSSSTVIF